MSKMETILTGEPDPLDASKYILRLYTLCPENAREQDVRLGSLSVAVGRIRQAVSLGYQLEVLKSKEHGRRTCARMWVLSI
jgi:hypothetical protein